MNNNLLISWLRWYDPIHRGWNLSGIANGICMTNGFSFPRIAGGYNLYRGIEAVPEPGSQPVGAAGAGSSTIKTFPWVSHKSDTIYQYRLVSVGGGGIENWTGKTVASLATDELGEWKGRVPNAPTDLQVTPLSNGRFCVRWTYVPQGQETEPAGFSLYTTCAGDWDYGSVASSELYIAGHVHYQHITLPRENGERVGWVVRAYSPTGYEEQNMNPVFAFARSQPPPVNPAVIVTVC